MPQFAKWYSCNVDPLGRSAGRSAVSAAAYRIGAELYDERTQTTHDYTRRSGVEAAFIVAPDHAPEWAHDPQKLWNEAERAENKCNSRTAREVKLALPASVDLAEREKITRAFAEHLAQRYGVAAMVALHEPPKHGDGRNYHAHILMTTRRIGGDGFGDKTRELDDWKTGKQEIRHIRAYAADLINASLADSGSGERVSPDSYKARGIDKTPTVHLGVQAAAMERKGKASERGDINRAIAASNQHIGGLLQERAGLDTEIKQQPQSQREELRSRHYAQVAKQMAVLQKPEVRKAALKTCQGAADEFIRKRINQAPRIEPPQNPLEPTPRDSYAAKIKRERERREQDIGIDI